MKTKVFLTSLQIIGIILLVDALVDSIKQGLWGISVVFTITIIALFFISYVILKHLKKEDLENKY